MIGNLLLLCILATALGGILPSRPTISVHRLKRQIGETRDERDSPHYKSNLPSRRYHTPLLRNALLVSRNDLPILSYKKPFLSNENFVPIRPDLRILSEEVLQRSYEEERKQQREFYEDTYLKNFKEWARQYKDKKGNKLFERQNPTRIGGFGMNTDTVDGGDSEQGNVKTEEAKVQIAINNDTSELDSKEVSEQEAKEDLSSFLFNAEEDLEDGSSLGLDDSSLEELKFPSADDISPSLFYHANTFSQEQPQAYNYNSQDQAYNSQDHDHDQAYNSQDQAYTPQAQAYTPQAQNYNQNGGFNTQPSKSIFLVHAAQAYAPIPAPFLNPNQDLGQNSPPRFNQNSNYNLVNGREDFNSTQKVNPRQDLITDVGSGYPASDTDKIFFPSLSPHKIGYAPPYPDYPDPCKVNDNNFSCDSDPPLPSPPLSPYSPPDPPSPPENCLETGQCVPTKDDKAVKNKLFQLIINTKSDIEKKVIPIRQVHLLYSNSALYQIGYLISTINKTQDTVANFYEYVERNMHSWDMLKVLHAYEQVKLVEAFLNDILYTLSQLISQSSASVGSINIATVFDVDDIGVIGFPFMRTEKKYQENPGKYPIHLPEEREPPQQLNDEGLSRSYYDD